MFCIPSTLTSPAQIHSSYQHEAECVLYQQVYISILDPKGECCLDTLSSNPENASFLRSLTVGFPTSWERICDESYRTAMALPTVPCHLKALSDPRIRLPNNNHYNSFDRKDYRYATVSFVDIFNDPKLKTLLIATGISSCTRCTVIIILILLKLSRINAIFSSSVSMDVTT